MKNVSVEVANIESNWREMNDESNLSYNSTLEAFHSGIVWEMQQVERLVYERAKQLRWMYKIFSDESNATMESNEFFGIVCKIIVHEFMGDWKGSILCLSSVCKIIL
jgi:hypothetical protein